MIHGVSSIWYRHFRLTLGVVLKKTQKSDPLPTQGLGLSSSVGATLVLAGDQEVLVREALSLPSFLLRALLPLLVGHRGSGCRSGGSGRWRHHIFPSFSGLSDAGCPHPFSSTRWGWISSERMGFCVVKQWFEIKTKKPTFVEGSIVWLENGLLGIGEVKAFIWELGIYPKIGLSNYFQSFVSLYTFAGFNIYKW